MSEKHKNEVPEWARAHSPGNGITEDAAKRLDYAYYLMESGNPDGNVQWDESSETEQHPSDIGGSSHSAHKGISSNEQVAFGSLVHRTKNENPGVEYEDAYDMAVDAWNAKHGDDEDNDEDNKENA